MSPPSPPPAFSPSPFPFSHLPLSLSHHPLSPLSPHPPYSITPSLTRYHLLLCLPLSLLFPHPPHAIHASTLHAPPPNYSANISPCPNNNHASTCHYMIITFPSFKISNSANFPLPNITSPHHDFLPQIPRSQHFFSTQFILRQ